jgi:hypothetical protein
MAQGDRPRRRAAGWGRRLAAALLAAFPLFVAAGMLAPAWVAVEQDPSADAGAPGELPILLAQGTPTPRDHPLLVPRDFSAGFVPELLDPHNLFLGTRYELDTERTARLLGFPYDQGDSMVIDDVEHGLEDVVFEDALLVAAVVDRDDLVGDGIHSLPSPIPFGDGLRDDDFAGRHDDPLIPEPSTAPLVALGLALLSLRGRRAALRVGRLSSRPPS